MKNDDIKSEGMKSSGKITKTWSRVKRTDDWTESVNVEKLDGPGYLISINIYGTNSKGKYKDITKKYYSENNILEKDSSEPVDELFDLLMGNK